MKLLQVLSSDDTYNLISFHLAPMGFEPIRYYHVLKAMDNIDEIDPRGIIISARDYPRHWKTMIQFIRSERPKNTCPIIVFVSEGFSVDERTKAHYLGVSGIVPEDFKDPSDIGRVQEILCRYLPGNEKRRSRRYHVQPWQCLNYVFSIPEEKSLIIGEVKTISSGGFSFLPEHSSLLRNARLHDEFTHCSLRVGEAILSPVCRLVRTGRIISFEFVSFPQNEQQVLDDYLLSSPLREWKMKNTESLKN
jgi:hypothetical protein